ncbi:MAG: Hpt domain-containing protein [Spirochaetales bacterium]|nr:Hpt domain-containing protein [Spirochaetales bacterium]
MKDSNQAITKKLRALMTKFARKLPSRLKQMEDHLNILINRSWDKGVAKQLYADLHKLSGTGTSFGFKKLSEKSRQMEEYMTILLKNDHNLQSRQVKELCGYFKELQRSVDHFQTSWVK